MSLIMFILFFSCNSFAQNQKISSFGNAKSKLRSIYGNKNHTFYCNCPYQKKSIKLKKCNLSLKKFKKRSKRLEWEHIVPAHAFGQSFIEWRNSKSVCGFKVTKKGKKKKISSRKCAKRNKLFKFMEADIYNLVPAIGSVNALRSNFSMANLKKSDIDICPGVMKKKRNFMPANDKKGDVARIYMYMDSTYPNRGIISKKRRKLFKVWDQLDPVDMEECTLIKLKQKYQVNKNNIVLSRCKAKGL